MRKNIEDTNIYQRKWYQKRKEKAMMAEKLTTIQTPSQFVKFALVGLILSLTMSGVSLWLSWRAYDIAQWIAGQ